MKSKLIEAGKPIEVKVEPSLGGAGGRTLSLTLVSEISAGKDYRLYKVKDEHGFLYVYKYMKRRTLQKEIRRTEGMDKTGVLYARTLASGRDTEDRGAGYILREWVPGARGDKWLRLWESLGAPLQADGVLGLYLFLDTLSRNGQYIGGLGPEDLVFAKRTPATSGWVVVNAGKVREMAPALAANRYFWKFIDRWGIKLDRHGGALTNFFQLLTPLGKDFPAMGVAMAKSESLGAGLTEHEDDEDEDDSEDDYANDDEDDENDGGDEDDGESEIPAPVPAPPAPLAVMDFQSAYPGTPLVEGGFRGESYELLKDGTERINGVPVSSEGYEGARFESEDGPSTPSDTPKRTNTDESESEGPSQGELPEDLFESTAPQESATSTVEVPVSGGASLNPLVDESTGKKSESE